jgi:metallo-beta-lactamase family protein
VIIAGFQSRGTRGSQLAEGATEVKIHGAYVPVRAEVVAIDAFSGHADSDDLMAWADTSREAPQTSFVIHGEPEASAALRTRLRGASWTAVIPKFGERVVV